MQVKTCPITVKTAGAHEGGEEGVFEAIVAAYNVDSVGDRIMPGAFQKSLAEWKTSGNPLPVIWAHKSDDPEYHIGHVLEAEERPEGLWVKAQLDIEDPSSKSAKVYKLLKGRRVTQMSFAYDEIDARPAQKSDLAGAKKELHELKLYEVGPCLIGANQQTNLLGVKRDLDAATTADMWRSFGRSLEGISPPSGLGKSFALPQTTVSVKVSSDSPPISDVINEIKTTGALSKEHVPVLNSLLATLAARMNELTDVLDALNGPDGGQPEKATPAQPAVVPAPEAKDDAPARHGTASAHQPDVLMALALLEAEQGAYTI